MRTRRNKKKKTIVFVNGCFDMLHSAHVQLLEKAKSLGTKLIVGLNSDRSIRALKGAGRPIMNEENRKYMLESLRCVDEVVVFNEKRITNIVNRVKPDIVVQGDSHTEEQIRKIDRLPPRIRIALFPRGNVSTSAIIEKIRRG